MDETKSLTIYITSILLALLLIGLVLGSGRVSAATDIEEPVPQSYSEVQS